jgi:hypothetical protein
MIPTRVSNPLHTQTFKLNAESIRVVATSDLPIEIRQQPASSTASFTSSTSRSIRRDIDHDTDLDPCMLFNVVHETGQSQPPTQSQSTQPLSEEKLEDLSMEICS